MAVDSTMRQVLLDVRGLKKYFPVFAGLLRHVVGQIKAVDGIDFHIGDGEVLGVVGESGSGKSTAARAAIRLVEPTAGKVIFDGIDFLSLKPDQLKDVRKKMQIVFQDPYSSLNPRKPIWLSIGEALEYHGVVTEPHQLRDVVAEILRRIGISVDAMDNYPHQFSGGQQQRICIGRAIAMKPKLIVCDEAVSSLDVSVQAQILNLLMELKETMNLSYLFISHDLSIVRHISDRVVVMHEGKAVESGDTETIFSDPQHPYTRKLLAALPIDHPRERRH